MEQFRAIDVDAATRTVEVDSGTFPVIDHGEGPVVLLLHGFPDSRRLWRYQVPALADAGFRVLAPDLRGFGDAPMPDGVAAYRIEAVLGDLESILAALDVGEFRLVGHDWGAQVAWEFATHRQEDVRRLVLLSVGPGKATEIDAWEQSWYRWFFQFEEAPEAWLRHDDWRLFREWLREEGDFDRYLEDLSRPGRLTAALNWYRANVSATLPGDAGSDGSGSAETSSDDGETAEPQVHCPVMGVWSDGDHHLAKAQMTETEPMVGGPWRYERIEGASHWIPLDEPDMVNELLADFLTE